MDPRREGRQFTCASRAPGQRVEDERGLDIHAEARVVDEELVERPVAMRVSLTTKPQTGASA